jgi:NhaP-type Na+/H+ or K+/H+ antiporter
MSVVILFALILIGGWLSGKVFSKIGLPSILGMLACGICIGQLFKGSLPPTLFELEPFLKSFALIVILLRAGLGINKKTLEKSGRTAILMSFVPFVLEGIALSIAFHYIFHFTWSMSCLTGFMLSAVSPAVVVPSMLHLKNNGFGKRNEVPTIILAGASADNVLAISFFSVFLYIATTGGTISIFKALFSIPTSLIIGIAPGILAGTFLVWFFQQTHKYIRAPLQTLILLVISVALIHLGNILHGAALLGVMAIGFILLEKEENIAHEIANKLSKIWVIAEIILFVLIGISVDPQVAFGAGFLGLAVISIGLIFRAFGVLIATWWSDLTIKERIFCMIAYLPKATVQAALGGVALSCGLAEGSTILAIAVLAIIFTSPLGVIGIKYSAKHLLKTDFTDN